MTKEELLTYQGKRAVPKEFDAFWKRQIAGLSKVPAYELVPKATGISGIDCQELYFSGTNKGMVYAKLLLPANKKNVPMIFHFHGYQGSSSDWSEYFKYVMAGYGVVAMDVRGQAGKSIDHGQFNGTTVKGQIVRGLLAGPTHLFYKDIYLDVYTLIELVAAFEFVDEKNLQTLGDSQGGALALVGAALNPRIKQFVALYPFLTDFSRILELGQVTEPYDDLFRYFRYVDPLHQTEAAIMDTLDYIDVKNFAHLIQGRVHVVVGMQDEICPPSAQFAFYNRVTSPKQYDLVPEYGHEPMMVKIPDLIMNWLTGTII